MINKRPFIFLFLLTFTFTAFAQVGDGESGLRTNAAIKKFHQQNPGFVFGNRYFNFQGKHGVGDTLQLPFFDDFSTGEVITLDTLWTNYSVFVNSDFPVDPPSIGVATFDGLDHFGNAYADINPDIFGGADTLTSQPINLSSYALSDSIFLSFFYQAQGYSYEVLESKDSLVLQFRNQIGAWVNVWSVPGQSLSAFKIAVVGLPDNTYLHSGFQFRFINYMKHIGNLKQWHLDYVYMNQGRTKNDTLFEDQSVTYKPSFPFIEYSHMPWNQLKGNFGKYLKGTYTIRANNMATSGETFSIELQARDENNNQVGFEKLTGNVLPASSHSNYLLTPNITLVSNGADSSELKLVTKISDILGGNDVRRNDSSARTVELANYYAYDDGTAETGYGIRNGSGSVAYGFELEQDDTLRAISIHFTQAEKKVNNSFILKAWKTIAPPGVPSGSIDQVIYSKQISLPQYIDSINGYYTFYLDTPQYITGKFYIGWTQNSSYMLNVGFDRNYTRQGQDTTNPNLFYNVGGKWYPASVKGTLMMRPHVGPSFGNPLSVEKTPPFIEPSKVYPNPARDGLNIWLENSDAEKMDVFDLSGKKLATIDITNNYADLKTLPGGVFLYRIYSTEGKVYFGKFIKQD